MSPQVVPGSVHDKSPKLADLADKKRISPSINELVSVEQLERTPLELSADGRSATVTLPAEIQAHFAFRLIDEHGLINEEPHRQFLVLLDQPPRLELAGSPRDEAQPTDAYPLKVSVADDFGFGALELHVTSPKGLSKVVALASEKLNAPAFENEFRIDLADLGVKAGDLLTLQVRAVDERPLPAANEIWSPERTLSIRENAAAPGSREALERQTELRDELTAIRKELADEAKQAAALESAAQKDAENKQPFSQQPELKKLAEREDQTSDRLQELAERFAEHPLFANLKAETERLAEQEIAPQAEQLKLAEKFATADIAGQLQDNSAAIKQAEQKVAAIEKKFADLAKLERDLLEVSRLAQRANELADDAERLEAKREELSSDKQLEGDREQDRQVARSELAREEGQLAKEQGDLLNNLNELLEKRPEIVPAARDHQLNRLAELAEQAHELAKSQDAVTDALKAEAERKADAAQPAIEKQREITERTEQLAATIDAQQARNPVSPVDPEVAQKILDELQKGNLAAAEQLAKQSADDLDRAIADLQKNQPLPADPREAAKELAARQRELSKDIAKAAADQSATDSPDSSKSPAKSEPVAARPPLDETPSLVRDLAAREAALQMAAAQLNPDPDSRDEQKAAVDKAAETLRQLIEAQKAKDAETAEPNRNPDVSAAQERTREALAQAAERSESAAEALDRLAEKAKPAEISKFADGADSKAPQPSTAGAASTQLAEQLQELAQEQRDLEREIGELAQNQQPMASPADQQRQLTQEAAGLEKELDELSQQLGTAPINLGEPSKRASQAGAAATQGKQAMQQAAANQADGNPREAAQDSEQAADQLRQTATEASSSPRPQPANESPIPGNLANQLTSAAQRLSQSQQRLDRAAEQANTTQSEGQPASGLLPAQAGAQPKQSSASSPTSTSKPESPSSSPAGTNQQSANTSGPSGSLPPPSAESLRQAAKNLTQAAAQLKTDSAPSPNAGQTPSNRQPSLAEGDSSPSGGFSSEPPNGTAELAEPKKQPQRNWGKLPGGLQTEILQSTQRKTKSDYSNLTKFYFDELATSQKQSAPTPKQ